MKSNSLVLAFAITLAFGISATAAVKKQEMPDRGSGDSEPFCPVYDCNDQPDRGPDGKHQETYEDGGSGYGDVPDDGYEREEGGGGMINELFSVQALRAHPPKNTVRKEDRGSTVVYTTMSQEDMSASETCTTIVVTVVEKATGKVLSTQSREDCNTWPL